MSERQSLFHHRRPYRAHAFFKERLVYFGGATPLWGWQSWVGGRMFCVGKWALYFTEAE